MRSGFLSKRNLAIVFGAVFVLSVAIVAAAIGIGHPNVPSDDVAVVDDDSIDVPGLVDEGVISKTNFDRFLDQTAKQSGLQSVPQPSDPQYKQLKDQAMQSALQIAWIVGEANRRDLSFTDTQIQQSLSQIKSQFKTEEAYVKARDQAGLTDQDVLERAKLQLIQNKIQDDVSNGVPPVSDDAAQDYYDSNKQQFTQPAQRTIRIIQNNDANQVNQALAALRADDSAANWKKVAAQYSTDTVSKDKGGLRSGVVPGSFQQPLDDDIFNAPTGQVQGPVTTPTGSYAFEVFSATPEKVQGFDETTTAAGGGPAQKVSDQIKQQIRGQQQQEALTAFGEDFRSYWTNLTQCNTDYLVEGCDNFNGAGPGCDPDKLGPSQPGQPAQGCPAPVFASCQEGSTATGGQPGQLQCTGSGPAPVAPGTFKPFVPTTGGAPQTPHPAGESTTPTLPAGLGGLGG
ncbi:MAG TPA: peptidyl-prolyl cis-trans isomerase [Solirubrobacterales bacterium]|nr:peptidyl-prolyl cis-trans isomerase [Solirubrobacterales bacterium]